MKYNTNIFKITFTGIMLSLVLMFQYLERFMPLAGDFFKINLSVVFVLFTTFVAGYSYSFILQLIRLVIGPAISGGYTPPNIFGMAISFFTIFIFTTLAYLAYKTKLIKSKGPIILSLGIITLITSLIITLANGLFLVDIWVNLLSQFGFKRQNIIDKWGIGTYWGSIFAIYLTGNIINLGIGSFLFSASYSPFKKYMLHDKKSKV